MRTARPLQLNTLACCLAAAWPGLGWSQPTSSVANAPKVTVTATRIESNEDEVPATVTSLTRSHLDRRPVGSAADLFADEPDLALARDARRFGATRPNIRGLEDNRVVQQVDGVRLSDYYNGGGPTNFTMSAPATVVADFLKRVEVVRGGSSTLYGSDAMGGVVGYLTLDPSDLLRATHSSALRAKATWLGASGEKRLTALGAYRSESTQFLVGVSTARAHETDNQGDDVTVSATRTRPNPRRAEDAGVLAKMVLQPVTGHKVVLGLEGRDQSIDAEILRLSASLRKVTAMTGGDHARRIRGSVEWEHKSRAGFYDRLQARLYHQRSDTENHNLQQRTSTSASCSAVSNGASTCSIEQLFTFSQQSAGVGLQMEKAFRLGAASHLFAAGVDASSQKTTDYRDATVHNLTTGTTSKTLAGDSFPLRDFANGRTDTLGLFVQDEVFDLAGGTLTLTPGLRYDLRRLEPQVDALAQSVLTAIGKLAVEKSDGAWSPRLGALWRLSPTLAAYGHIARSYRAPNYNEVNGAFRNTVQSYGVSPNPELKPETGIGAEAGLRFKSPAWRGQVAVFDNHYKDFIDSVTLTCPADPACIPGLANTNMSVNLSRVRIYGAEVRGGWSVAAGWRLDGAVAYAKGTNQDSGAPINSIEPTRMSLAVLHEAENWGAEARLRAAARKSRVDDSGGAWFQPPGYGVADVSVWIQFGRGIRATLAIANLFDRKYWLWSDIRQADARNPAGVDFYSQPGRKLSAALQADF